jgi:hypothetical protein
MARTTVALMAVVLLAGCGGGGDSPTEPISSGAFTVTVTPNPIVAADCDPAVCGGEGVLVAVGNLVITETAGVGGFVNLAAISLRNTATNAEIGTLSYTAQEIAALAGTNRVSANGTLTIPGLGAAYRLPGGARAATMSFAVALTDDHSFPKSFLVTVPVI